MGTAQGGGYSVETLSELARSVEKEIPFCIGV